MTILYNIVTIENFADNAATEATLNAEGADNWSLTLANFKPNPQTGKSTATIIFKKSLITSSSSSSSSNSLSTSSSSFSDFTFMGSGWPFPPDQIEVTIGSFWRFANVPFVEDEVVRLIRAPDVGTHAHYTEDGTNVANNATNRLMLSINTIGAEGATVGVFIEGEVPNLGTPSNFDDAFSFSYGNPYNFAAAFDASHTFTSYIDTQFFNTTLTSGTTFYYKNSIFKTFTFIDN